MLFQKRFHDGIRHGTITQTFRAWETPRVRAGRPYRCPPIGLIEVDAVEEVRLGEVEDGAASAAGFEDASELRSFLQSSTTRRITSRSRVFRVRFRFRTQAVDPREAKQLDTSKPGLDDVILRLESIDRRSRRGPWTRQVLELIAQHPRTSAARLAPQADRERLPFKADVRKLKELGLTISHDVGYSLSRRGEAVLKRLKG